MTARPRVPWPRSATLAIASGVLAMGALTAAPVDAATTRPPELGSAASFAVLAGSPSVSSEGASSITGNLGIDPWPTVKGFPPGTLTGQIHRADNVAAGAKRDLAAAYAAAASAAPTSRVAGGALGKLTLPPGVYAADAALDLTDAVVLDANGDPDAVWILQAGSDLVTSAASVVRLANGGRSCNVYWQVAGSATLGAGSRFVGTILAAGSIGVGSGAGIDGRLLARDGSVSLIDDTIELPTTCHATATAYQPRVPGVLAGGTPDASAPASAAADAPRPRTAPAALLAALLGWGLAALLGRPTRRPQRRDPGRRHPSASAAGAIPARRVAMIARASARLVGTRDEPGSHETALVPASGPFGWVRRVVAYTRPAIALLMSLLSRS